MIVDHSVIVCPNEKSHRKKSPEQYIFRDIAMVKRNRAWLHVDP